MRRIRILVILLVLAFVGLGWTAAAHAQDNFRTGNDVTLPAGQSLSTSLFASGRTVDIAGNVDGDIFCLGQDVTVTGNVTGDVICAGQTVHVAGHVDGNIRVAGQTVTIGGTTARSLTAAGQNVTLDASGTVGGDTTIGGQSITINGTVGRDLAVSAPSVIINGAVSRDVQAQVTNLTLGDGSRVGGSVAYTSRNDISRAKGAVVGGTISRTEPISRNEGSHFGALIGGGFLFALYWFITLLIVALVMILLIPQFIHDATEVALRSPWKTLLVGLIASILVPIIIFVLMFTVVGIPLSLLLLLSWIVIVCVAVPFAGYYLGSLLLGKNAVNPIWTMLLGTAIILVLYMIPFLSFFVWLVATWFGLGIILLQYSRLPRPSYRVK